MQGGRPVVRGIQGRGTAVMLSDGGVAVRGTVSGIRYDVTGKERTIQTCS